MRLLLALALLGGTTPALGCVPYPPQAQLQGENSEEFRARSHAFDRARAEEEQRRYQAGLFDRATRISLARVIAAEMTERDLGDGLSKARRVEGRPLALLKGLASSNASIALEDRLMTTCGKVGGGTATGAAIGAYVILFEDVGQEATTGHVGILLAELREPRLLQDFDEAIRKAGLTLPAK